MTLTILEVLCKQIFLSTSRTTRAFLRLSNSHQISLNVMMKIPSLKLTPHALWFAQNLRVIISDSPLQSLSCLLVSLSHFSDFQLVCSLKDNI